jgi:RNA-splicing ligase RtcB
VDLVDQVFDAKAAASMGLEEGCLALSIHCGSGFRTPDLHRYRQSYQTVATTMAFAWWIVSWYAHR